MRAKDLPPGTEVAVGGSKYDRRFAVVVATGPWVRWDGRWVRRPGRPGLPVVALLTGRLGSIERTRAWWAEHRDTDPAELSPLVTEPLGSVRCPWAEEAVRLDELRRQRIERESAADAARQRVERLRDELEQATGLRASVIMDTRGLRITLAPGEVERWLAERS